MDDQLTADTDEPTPEDRAAKALADAAQILASEGAEPVDEEEAKKLSVDEKARKRALRLLALEIRDIRGRLRAESY